MILHKARHSTPATYHRSGGGRGSVVDLTQEEFVERRAAWAAAGGLSKRLENKRVIVHPSLLTTSCKPKGGTVACCYLQVGLFRLQSRCVWFGDDQRSPWRRPPECICDAKAGLIDDIEQSEAAE